MLYVGKVTDRVFSNSFFLLIWLNACAFLSRLVIRGLSLLTIFTHNNELFNSFYSDFPIFTYIWNNVFIYSDLTWKYAINCEYSIFGAFRKKIRAHKQFWLKRVEDIDKMKRLDTQLPKVVTQCFHKCAGIMGKMDKNMSKI